MAVWASDGATRTSVHHSSWVNTMPFTFVCPNGVVTQCEATFDPVNSRPCNMRVDGNTCREGSCESGQWRRHPTASANGGAFGPDICELIGCSGSVTAKVPVTSSEVWSVVTVCEWVE